MKRNALVVLTSLVCISLSMQALAASVWRISKSDQQLFIGGTIHILSQKDYPLPDAYDKAYQQSQALVFETDMQAIMSPQFQQQSMLAMSFRDGRTIKDVLSEDTMKALSSHLSSRGIPLQNICLLYTSDAADD